MNFISSLINQQYVFKEIQQIKSIKFRVNLQTKHYQKILGQSYTVYDTKGNPQVKGVLLLTNMRIIWHAPYDKNINICIGFDAIHQLTVKQMMVCNSFSYILFVNASDDRCRYGFKFTGFGHAQYELFNKACKMFNEMVATKQLRQIKISNSKIQPQQKEEIFTTYNDCFFQTNSQIQQVTVTTTNSRIIICKKQKNDGNYYGIPWISIHSLSRIQAQFGKALKIKIRSSEKMIFQLGSKSKGSEMQKQIISLGQTFSKHPLFNLWEQQTFAYSMNSHNLVFIDVQQIEDSNMNIYHSSSKTYESSNKGSFQDTFYCEQLGILMQTFPEGYQRSDIWNIFQS